jgi:hypothetical protein
MPLEMPTPSAMAGNAAGYRTRGHEQSEYRRV